MRRREEDEGRPINISHLSNYFSARTWRKPKGKEKKSRTCSRSPPRASTSPRSASVPGYAANCRSARTISSLATATRHRISTSTRTSHEIERVALRRRRPAPAGAKPPIKVGPWGLPALPPATLARITTHFSALPLSSGSKIKKEEDLPRLPLRLPLPFPGVQSLFVIPLPLLAPEMALTLTFMRRSTFVRPFSPTSPALS